MKRYRHYFYLFAVLSLSVLLNACTVVYKSTGDIMTGYAEEQGVPYLLATDDVGLACSMAEAFTPFLLSFSQVTTPPDELAILFYLKAGNCIEFKAWEEELRYLRAIYSKNSIEAQDARIAQQRFLAQSARRHLKGYRYFVSVFGEPGKECPDFDSERDELYWLMGLVNGMQAIINDIASSGNADVPLDIAAKVGRGASCLDNDKWWGTPDAIQAAIWITIPGNEPEDIDPMQILDSSLQTGINQGVIINHVLAAQINLGLGNIEKVKDIIRSHAEATSQMKVNQQYKILNQVATLQIQAISDRLWTEVTGKRTPMGRMGSFWGDSDKAVETIDIDDIL